MAASKVSREREMACSRDALLKVITDVEAYPEFITEVVSAKKLKGGTDKKFQVKFELEIVKRFEYVLEFNVTGKETVSWHLVESNFFKKNEGKWVLKELGPNKTAATYELDIALGFMVPGWVTKKLTETNLPKMFESFEKRAQ